MIGFSSAVALALCVIGNVCANAGFKRLVQSVEPEFSLRTLVDVVTSPWLWLGGLGSLLLLGSYLYAIRTLPLGVAYPIATSLGTVAVATMGILMFSEPLKLTNMAGIALVICGVLLISQ